jgi:hypothetical protein
VFCQLLSSTTYTLCYTEHLAGMQASAWFRAGTEALSVSSFLTISALPILRMGSNDSPLTNKTLWIVLESHSCTDLASLGCQVAPRLPEGWHWWKPTLWFLLPVHRTPPDVVVGLDILPMISGLSMDSLVSVWNGKLCIRTRTELQNKVLFLLLYPLKWVEFC